MLTTRIDSDRNLHADGAAAVDDDARALLPLLVAAGDQEGLCSACSGVK